MADLRSTFSDIEPDLMPLHEYAARTCTGLTKAYEDARRDGLVVPVIKTGRRFFVSRRAFDELMTRQHGSRRDEFAAASPRTLA